MSTLLQDTGDNGFFEKLLMSDSRKQLADEGSQTAKYLLTTAATTLATAVAPAPAGGASSGRAFGSHLILSNSLNSHEDTAVLADFVSGNNAHMGGPPHTGFINEATATNNQGEQPSHNHAEHEIQLIAAISLLVLVIVVGIVGQVS